MSAGAWVVRVATLHVGGFDEQVESGGTLLECLRDAGLVTIHRRDEFGVLFDLHCPAERAGDSKAWSDETAARMVAAVGANAVSAPAWPI